MATELASAYLTLIPTLKNAGKQISAQLDGVDVSGSGRKMGKQISDGLSSSISSDGVKKLEAEVAKASMNVGSAMQAEKDAATQLAIAEQRLTETRGKYAAGSSQVMAAEARVESAKRKHAQATENVKSAEAKLKTANDQLSSANNKVASTSTDAAVKIKGMGGAASSVASTLKGVAGAAAGAFAAIGFGQLISEAAAATDATKKFKSTLDFAGLDTSAIDALTESTRKYADQTVYELGDIQNVTAQLAANSVKDYDKLAEAAGNLNAVAGGNAETFKSVGMVMTQTAGAGKLTTENWNQLADAIPGASGKLQEAMLKNGAYTGNFREAMEKGEISAEEFNQAIMELGFEDAAIEAAKSTATFEGAFGNLKAEVVGGLSDIIGKLQPVITGAVNGVAQIVGPAFDVLLAGVDKAMGGVSGFAERMATVFDPVRQAVAALQPLFVQIGEQVSGKLGPALSTVGPAVESVIAAVAPFVETLVSTVGPIIADIAMKLVNLATQISGKVAPIIEGLAQLIATAMPYIQTVWTNAMNAIKGVVDAVWPAIEQVIGTAMTLIQDVINVVLAVIDGDWSAAWEAVKTLAANVWYNITSLIGTAIGAVKGVIESVLQSISNIWGEAWNAVAAFFGGIWDGLKSAAGDGISAVYDTITGIKDKITGFFSNAGQWLVDAGRNILQGLWNGISGAMGWLGDQLAGIGDFIVQHKGPPSYDRVMLAENGELIMRGLIDGIVGQKPALASALRSVSADINAAPMLGAKSARGGSTVNNYYTIEGVTYAEGSDEGRAVAALFDVIGRTRAAYAASI